MCYLYRSILIWTGDIKSTGLNPLTDKTKIINKKNILINDIINILTTKNISNIWKGKNFCTVKSVARFLVLIDLVKENSHSWKRGSAKLNNKAGLKNPWNKEELNIVTLLRSHRNRALP